MARSDKREQLLLPSAAHVASFLKIRSGVSVFCWAMEEIQNTYDKVTDEDNEDKEKGPAPDFPRFLVTHFLFSPSLLGPSGFLSGRKGVGRVEVIRPSDHEELIGKRKEVKEKKDRRDGRGGKRRYGQSTGTIETKPTRQEPCPKTCIQDTHDSTQ